MTGENHCEPCCGAEPTLRVREKEYYGAVVAFVQYECAKCGHKGGLGILEQEAAMLWRHSNDRTPCTP